MPKSKTTKSVPLECTTATAWRGGEAFMNILKAIEGGQIKLIPDREKHVTAMRHAYKAMVEAG